MDGAIKNLRDGGSLAFLHHFGALSRFFADVNFGEFNIFMVQQAFHMDAIRAKFRGVNNDI